MGRTGRAVGAGLEQLGAVLMGYGLDTMKSKAAAKTKEQERQQSLKDQQAMSEYNQQLKDASPETQARIAGINSMIAKRAGGGGGGGGRSGVSSGKLPWFMKTAAGQNAGGLALAEAKAQGIDITPYLKNPAAVIELPSFKKHFAAQTQKSGLQIPGMGGEAAPENPYGGDAAEQVGMAMKSPEVQAKIRQAREAGYSDAEINQYLGL